MNTSYNNISTDIKDWYALSCPVATLRFDKRTLELLDSDCDGHIRVDEVLAAIDFVKSHEGVEARELAAISADIASLDKIEPPNAAEQEMRKAAAALAAVENAIDAFFLPPEDAPLVDEGPEKQLPLKANVNVRYLGVFDAFRDLCILPQFGADKATLSFREWSALKEKYAAFHGALQPSVDGSARAKLEEEEKLAVFRQHLDEFLANFVTMEALYGKGEESAFQTGTLRIDEREMKLCFSVASEADHAALSGRSNCCVIYAKLTRPADGATRNICAVVTAGRVCGLYVGRNGVFYDRDGGVWEAQVTKLVENQVSLLEAFFYPWRKLGEAVAGVVRKFVESKKTAADQRVQNAVTVNPATTPKPAGAPAADNAGGAAMASSVAAIGIGIGMVGAAAASLLAAIKGMTPLQWAIAVASIIAIVSVPNVILTWFKLRRRELGAILNASGWAVNRQMRFSMAKAREFTEKR